MLLCSIFSILACYFYTLKTFFTLNLTFILKMDINGNGFMLFISGLPNVHEIHFETYTRCS